MIVFSLIKFFYLFKGKLIKKGFEEMLVGFRGKAFASLQSFKIFQLPLSTTYFQQNKFQFQHVGSRNYAIFSPKPVSFFFFFLFFLA